MEGTAIQLIGGPWDGLKLVVELPSRHLLIYGRLFRRQPSLAAVCDTLDQPEPTLIPYADLGPGIVGAAASEYGRP